MRAMSTSCPKCYKALIIEDIVIKTAHAVRKVQTCGKVLVEPKGRLIAASIEAAQGIEVLGVLEGNAISGGPVRIGEKAQWKGDLRAPSLRVDLGARIARGYFVIPDDTLSAKETAANTQGSAVEAKPTPTKSPGNIATSRAEAAESTTQAPDEDVGIEGEADERE
jgi:cytoskeletal protein CcmA (bactofilin family)